MTKTEYNKLKAKRDWELFIADMSDDYSVTKRETAQVNKWWAEVEKKVAAEGLEDDTAEG